jgi:hypothetical protein
MSATRYSCETTGRLVSGGVAWAEWASDDVATREADGESRQDEIEVDLRRADWEVRDQGDWPTCMAFAVTAAHEIVCDLFELGLSEPGLIYAFTQVSGSGLIETSFSVASEALQTFGQPAEIEWRYDPQQIGDELLNPPPCVAAISEWRRASLRSVPCTFSDVRHLITSGYPVALGLPLTTSMFLLHPDDAWLQPEPESDIVGAHVMTAVGIVEARSSSTGIMLRNSWGPKWGFNGYCFADEHYLDACAYEAWVVSD